MADVAEKVGQDLSKIIETAMQIIEERLTHDDSKEALLAKVFVKENAAGKKTEYKLVPREFVEDLKKTLCDRDIPFISTRTSTGDALFLCTEDHSGEFLRAQADVFSLSTTMSRECTASRMAELASAGHDKRVVVLSFTDERMAAIAQQELYENDVVCSMNNFREEDVPGEPELNARMYVSTSSVYCSYRGGDHPARDLASAEFRLAIIQTMGDANPVILDTRKEQAKYDRETLEEFAKVVHARSGEAFLANDEQLAGGKYLSVKNGAVFLHNVENGVDKVSDIKIGKDASLQEIMATVSRQGLSIRNKVLIRSEKEFKRLDPYNEEAFKNGEDTSKMACSKRIVGRVQLENDVRDGLYKIADAISREASAYVDREHPHKSSTQKYELKKERMIEIARHMIETKKLPSGISPDFLDRKVMDSHSSPTVSEYLSTVVAHFEDTHEKHNDEVTVDVEVVNRRLRDRIAVEEALDRDRMERRRETERDEPGKEDDKEEVL